MQAFAFVNREMHLAGSYKQWEGAGATLVHNITLTLIKWLVSLYMGRSQVQIPARQFSGSISGEDECKSPFHYGVPIEESHD